MIGFCQYCKENKRLCNAHITPKCFYVKSSDKPFLQISENQVLKRLPVGFYDNGILCRDCDGKFSPNEEYAKRLFNDEFLQQFRSNIYKNTYVLEKNDFNYTKIRQFVLSMLWKASVSKKNECSCVNLGKYEDVCLQVLKDPTGDISDLFNILIFKFKERDLKGLVFVVHFLSVHPFKDGNGRMSRALTTMLMLQSGYSYMPYASMESIIEASKGMYYRAFEGNTTHAQKARMDRNHDAICLDIQNRYPAYHNFWLRNSGRSGTRFRLRLGCIPLFKVKNNKVYLFEFIPLFTIKWR